MAHANKIPQLLISFAKCKLKDKAYNLSDKYTGKVGISWLHRWTITKGLEMHKEPGLPEFMEQFDQTGVSGSGFKSAQKVSN